MQLTIEEAKDKCLYNLAKGAGTVVQITGPPAAGRRQLLRELQTQLSATRPTAYLEVQAEDFDSGAIALAQMGRSSLNGAYKQCRELTLPFSKKTDAVVSSLKEDTVILLYAPWLKHELNTANRARAHWRFQHLLEALVNRFSVIAVAGNLPGAYNIHLRKWYSSQDWANSEFSRTLLAGAAEKLLHKQHLNSRLEIRLAVGLVALGEDLKVIDKELERYQCVGTLLDMFWNLSSPWLRKAWHFFASTRQPIIQLENSPDVPDLNFLSRKIGIPSPLEQDILRYCLGFERDGRLVLHEETIQKLPDYVENDPVIKAAVAEAFEIWTAYFKNSAQPWLAIESELHRDFQQIASGVLPEAFIFQDQYALAGRFLSRNFRLFEQAAACYEKAIELDPEDAYSHHYLAYNRSRIRSLRSDLVVAEFEQAIALEPNNVYWYPRYISWLVRNGQFIKARSLWDQAVEETRDICDNYNYYDVLHREVFRASIFVDYELSLRIVDDLGQKVRDVDRFRRMRLLTELHRLADEHCDVVPTSVIAKAQKLNLLGPHLLPPSYKGVPLEHWYAAKVDEKTSDSLFLICGRYEDRKESFFTLELSITNFQASQGDTNFEDIGPGRFLEVGIYGTTSVVRVHPETGLDLREVLGY